MFLLNDGSAVKAEEIKKAFEDGKVRLVHAHNYASKGLGDSIKTSVTLDGVDRDTRGQCYSAWEEVWTTVPETILEALEIAWYSPSGQSFWDSLDARSARDIAAKAGKARAGRPAAVAASRENGKKGGRPAVRYTLRTKSNVWSDLSLRDLRRIVVQKWPDHEWPEEGAEFLDELREFDPQGVWIE